MKKIKTYQFVHYLLQLNRTVLDSQHDSLFDDQSPN